MTFAYMYVFTLRREDEDYIYIPTTRPYIDIFHNLSTSYRILSYLGFYLLPFHPIPPEYIRNHT